MKKQLKAVEKFHNTFKQIVNEFPVLIDNDLAKLRYDLGKEELDEYLEAVKNGDLVGIFDSLGDQLYILCGTILCHGGQHIIEKCFDEIQKSNMSKLDDSGRPIINGENGVFDTSRRLGKILKSSNFSEPNLSQFLYEKENI